TSAPATMSSLYAVDTLVPTVWTTPALGEATLNGASLTAAELAASEAWTTAGFDLSSAWVWDDELARPVLRRPAGSTVVSAVHRTVHAAESAQSDPVRVVAGGAETAQTQSARAVSGGSHSVSVGSDGIATVTFELG